MQVWAGPDGAADPSLRRRLAPAVAWRKGVAVRRRADGLHGTLAVAPVGSDPVRAAGSWLRQVAARMAGAWLPGCESVIASRQQRLAHWRAGSFVRRHLGPSRDGGFGALGVCRPVSDPASRLPTAQLAACSLVRPYLPSSSPGIGADSRTAARVAGQRPGTALADTALGACACRWPACGIAAALSHPQRVPLRRERVHLRRLAVGRLLNCAARSWYAARPW